MNSGMWYSWKTPKGMVCPAGLGDDLRWAALHTLGFLLTFLGNSVWGTLHGVLCEPCGGKSTELSPEQLILLSPRSPGHASLRGPAVFFTKWLSGWQYTMEITALFFPQMGKQKLQWASASNKKTENMQENMQGHIENPTHFTHVSL